MPVPIRASVFGAKELAAYMLAMEPKLFRKATRKAVDACTKLVLAAAKANVPSRTGMLKKALGRKVVAAKGGKGYVGIVGPRKDVSDKVRARQQREFEQGKRKRAPRPRFRKTILVNGKEMVVNPVKYAHLVEYGRAEVTPKKGATVSFTLPDGTTIFRHRIAAVPPRPFLRPAWDGNRAACESIIRGALKDAIGAAGR